MSELLPKEVEKTPEPVLICNSVLALKLLKYNLQIPDYQRPYCWEEKNIRDFLGDIYLQLKNNKYSYHLGSIILRQQPEKKFDVIDGQQRLTTLAIWYFSTNQEILPLLESSKNFTVREKRQLQRALMVVESSNFKVDLERILFNVVILPQSLPEDLAYTFFSNTNSTGKRLSDYDLLKTHHLRYIEKDEYQETYATKWHELEKSEKMDEVLHLMLYRLRKWSNNEQFPIDAANRESHDVFQHYKSVDTLSGFPVDCYCQKTLRFNSLLSGGKEFFDYVKHYGKEYRVFVEHPSIKCLENNLQGHSRGILCAGIKAISFLFFCKFGDSYLNEAVYWIAYCLSKLRNENRVSSKFIYNQNFVEITRSLDMITSDSQFFAMLIDPKKRYKETNNGNTADRYWDALHKLLDELSSEASFMPLLKKVEFE